VASVSIGVTLAASEQVNEVLLPGSQIRGTRHAMDGAHSGHRSPAFVALYAIARIICVPRAIVDQHRDAVG
jgi:hypothetical protein